MRSAFFAPLALASLLAGCKATTNLSSVQPSAEIYTRASLGNTNPRDETLHTTSFGHYEFNDVAAGQTYFLRVEAKGYTFNPPTLVVTPNFDVEDLNFTASSSPKAAGSRQ